MAYLKFHKVEEWNHIQMRTDEWEFTIIKELKGDQHVPRISIEVIDFLKRFVDFYVEEFDNSYIKFFGDDVAPLKLPCYLRDRIVFLEFVRQIFYFHEIFVKEKKEAPIKIPITCSWYCCNNWLEEKIIKCEIECYDFEYHDLNTHHEPIGVVDIFFQKFHTKYKHHSLVDIEKYRNVCLKMEIQIISK